MPVRLPTPRMVRPARKREELNRALHEVRRPLQSLLFLADRDGRDAPPEAAGELVELASAALADLDAVINGGPAVRPRGRIECRELVRRALERWCHTVPASAVRLCWDAGPAPVEGDPVGVAQALDNVLANAFEHGAPPVLVSGRTVPDRVRITVANAPARAPTMEPVEIGSPEEGGASSRDRGRGHGLLLVDEIMRAHGGRFAFTQSPSGAIAALELPLAGDAAEPGEACDPARS